MINHFNSSLSFPARLACPGRDGRPAKALARDVSVIPWRSRRRARSRCGLSFSLHFARADYIELLGVLEPEYHDRASHDESSVNGPDGGPGPQSVVVGRESAVGPVGL